MNLLDGIYHRNTKALGVFLRAKGGIKLGVDIITIVLVILLLIVLLRRCVLDWIEFRNWWWEIIADSEDTDDQAE